MQQQEATQLIKVGVRDTGKLWADLGAGSGVFTFALDEILGFGGVIFAIDLKLLVLREHMRGRYLRSTIHLYEKDFTGSLDFLPPLDGILLANSLHYVRDQKEFLRSLIHNYLRPTGVIVFVEYDRSDSNTWIPYPVSREKLKKLASAVELAEPLEIGHLPSIYGNSDIYAAVCKRLTHKDDT